MNFNFSIRSEKRLTGVHSDLIQLARMALQVSEVDFAITEGIRDQQRQNVLFKEGFSQTLNSRHLTGHAIDVMAWIDGHASWDWGYYQKINEAFCLASDELSIPVEWGGKWKTLKDGAHFQLPHKTHP